MASRRNSDASQRTPGGVSRKEKHENTTEGVQKHMPEWAVELQGLWWNEDPSLEAEVRYNTANSLPPPHCAVCSLFSQKQDKTAEKKTEDGAVRKPRFSKPLISDSMFTSNAGRLCSAGFTPAIDVEGRSPLVTCTSCAVCVHASCYGLQYDDDFSQWKCSKCAQLQYTASCWLCHLRGGALKRTTTGHWCHIVCALAVPEVAFESVVHRSPISVTRIPAARRKMKCEFCYEWTKEGAGTGVCIQCSDGVCTTSFHVSCAHAYGIRFTPADWPFPVSVTCHKHTDNKTKQQKRKYQRSAAASAACVKPVSRKSLPSQQSPVRQMRRTKSATNISELAHQSLLTDDAKLSVDNKIQDIIDKMPAKNTQPVVCLKFLSDTEVKRLSSPSASPVAKRKIDDNEAQSEKTPQTERVGPMKPRHKMGPYSRTLGKLAKSPLEKRQSKSLPILCNSGTPQVSDTTSPAVSRSPHVSPRRTAPSTTEPASHTPNLPKFDAPETTSSSVPERKIKSRERKIERSNPDEQSSLHRNACVNSKDVDESCSPAEVTEKSSTATTVKENQKTPLKSPKSVKSRKTLSSKTPNGKPCETSNVTCNPTEPDAGDKLKKAKSPKKSPQKNNNNDNLLGSVASKIVKSPKKASPKKDTPRTDSIEGGTIDKGSASSAKPVKKSGKKLLKTRKSVEGPAVKINLNESTDDSTVNGKVKVVVSSAETPSVPKKELSEAVPSNISSTLTKHKPAPLSLLTLDTGFTDTPSNVDGLRDLSLKEHLTLPVASSTPLQDCESKGSQANSPVTSRSRSGRAIKISTLALEAFMDSSEENNFGFLMGSSESSPDGIRSKPEEVQVKKMHWKTLQKLEKLKREQEEAAKEREDREGTPDNASKDSMDIPTTPNLSTGPQAGSKSAIVPHDDDHVQNIIDMVVANARASVEREELEEKVIHTELFNEDKKSTSSIPCQKPSPLNSSAKMQIDFTVSPKKAKNVPGIKKFKKTAFSPPCQTESKKSTPNVSPRASGSGVKLSPKPGTSGLRVSPRAKCVSPKGKVPMNDKLNDLIAKMSTRVKEIPPEDVPESSSNETTPNMSMKSSNTSKSRTDESDAIDDDDDEEEDEDESVEESDDEPCSSHKSTPHKSISPRKASPRKSSCKSSPRVPENVDDEVPKAQDQVDDDDTGSYYQDDWFKDHCTLYGDEDDNNNEALRKIEEDLEELESSRDSFIYPEEDECPPLQLQVDSSEEVEEQSPKPETSENDDQKSRDENNRLLSSNENPNEENKQNAFYSAELEKYLLSSDKKIKQQMPARPTQQSVRFKKGYHKTGWKDSMEPDIDEVEGVIFFSFSCKEALENHVKKEKSSESRMPRQVTSSLARYHAKIQQDAAVSGLGLYPRGSCRSLVKPLSGTRIEMLGLDLPTQPSKHPDFSRETEWRQPTRDTTYTEDGEEMPGLEPEHAADELTPTDTSRWDVNVTRIYGRKSDGTFARKRMMIPRLKRHSPNQPMSDTDKPEPPGLDKYESQSKEWGIVTAKIIQQRARELREEGFTFPRKKPLISYQPVTVTCSMALAAAAALHLMPTTPRVPTDTACKKLGCRYGCVCHLCESVPSMDEEEDGSENGDMTGKSHSCTKQYCRLGCICDSIEDGASSPRTPTHCGKPSCMFHCYCDGHEDKVKIEKFEVKVEEKVKEIKKDPYELDLEDDPPSVLSNSSIRGNCTRGRAKRGRGLGRGRGGLQGTKGLLMKPQTARRGRGSWTKRGQPKKPATATAAAPHGTEDHSEPGTEGQGEENADGVRKSSRLKEKPVFGIGNIDRLNSLVYFDTVAWLTNGDGPRKRRKPREEVITIPEPGSPPHKIQRKSGSRNHSESSLNEDGGEEMTIKMELSDNESEMSEVFADTSESTTCARANVYLPPAWKRKLEIKAEKETNPNVDGEAEVKIKAEKVSPKSKIKSPGAKQLTGLPDYVHPLMGKFKTQMVLLQRKRNEKPADGSPVPDTPYLLEIQSNCDWESIRSQLLSKVSAEMANVTDDAQHEYPNLTSFKIGAFIADILPRPEKATTIPPNLQRILKTKDMFPIRIRIIHSSHQMSVMSGNKTVASDTKSVTSETPVISETPVTTVTTTTTSSHSSSSSSSTVATASSTATKMTTVAGVIPVVPLIPTIAVPVATSSAVPVPTALSTAITGITPAPMPAFLTAVPAVIKTHINYSAMKGDPLLCKSTLPPKNDTPFLGISGLSHMKFTSGTSDGKPSDSEDLDAFVGLSSLSRLNLKLDGYPKSASPSSCQSSAAQIPSETVVEKKKSKKRDFKPANYGQPSPFRTPSPPPLDNEGLPWHHTAAQKNKKEKRGNLIKPDPLVFIPISNMTSLPLNDIVKACALARPPMITGSVFLKTPIVADLDDSVSAADPFRKITVTAEAAKAVTCGDSIKLSPVKTAASTISSTSMNTSKVPTPLTEVPTTTSSSSQALPIISSAAVPTQMSVATSDVKENVNEMPDSKINLNDKLPSADVSKTDCTMDGSDPKTSLSGKQSHESDSLMIPAGVLAAPTSAVGQMTLSVKAVVMGPRSKVETCHIPAGTSLNLLPVWFKLFPVAPKSEVLVKPSDCVNFTNDSNNTAAVLSKFLRSQEETKRSNSDKKSTDNHLSKPEPSLAAQVVSTVLSRARAEARRNSTETELQQRGDNSAAKNTELNIDTSSSIAAAVVSNILNRIQDNESSSASSSPRAKKTDSDNDDCEKRPSYSSVIPPHIMAKIQADLAKQKEEDKSSKDENTATVKPPNIAAAVVSKILSRVQADGGTTVQHEGITNGPTKVEAKETAAGGLLRRKHSDATMNNTHRKTTEVDTRECKEGPCSPGKSKLEQACSPSRGSYSIREGRCSPSRGGYSIKDGRLSPSRGSYSIREGRCSPSRGSYSIREGRCSPSRGSYSISSGSPSIDSMLDSHSYTPGLTDDEFIDVEDMDEDDAVDIEMSDGINILNVLRKQSGQDLSQSAGGKHMRKQHHMERYVTDSSHLLLHKKAKKLQRSGSPGTPPVAKRRPSTSVTVTPAVSDHNINDTQIRNLQMHCSRFDLATTTMVERKALERKRRHQLHSLFQNIQQMFDELLNIRFPISGPAQAVPKHRLLQAAIETIEKLKEDDVKLDLSRRHEATRRKVLLAQLRGHIKQKGGKVKASLSKLPGEVPPFNFMTWQEYMYKLPPCDQGEEDEEVEEAAPFNFRPIGEIEKGESSKPVAPKKGPCKPKPLSEPKPRRRKSDKSDTSTSSSKSSNSKQRQSQKNSPKPEIYIDIDDGKLFNDVAKESEPEPTIPSQSSERRDDLSLKNGVSDLSLGNVDRATPEAKTSGKNKPSQEIGNVTKRKLSESEDQSSLGKVPKLHDISML